MVQIEWIKEQMVTQAEEGITILEAMRQANLHPDAPCGGQGKCGKCRVRIEGQGEVLACQTKVQVPLRIDTLRRQVGEKILTEGVMADLQFDPIVRQVAVEMPACPAGRSISDWTRFTAALAKVTGQEDWQESPAIASMLGKLQKECGGHFYALVSDHVVLDVAKDRLPVYMAAFDIGTTTVAAYLLSGETGESVAVCSRMNPQAQFGADVINRANYTLEHGMDEVTGCIREAVDTMLGELAQQAGCSREDIRAVSIVGNTCMHHLFLGISPASLVTAPYNPAIAEGMILRASDYGLHLGARAPLYMLPNIAGFVGADTVACLVASDLDRQKAWTLLIDIGTNGEMVLGKDGDLAACSTAAGPAFEGAGITCGMRGSRGAISKARWEDDHWVIRTVDEAEPIGICGSGLLDLAAGLLESGQMDDTGQFALRQDRGEAGQLVLYRKGEREVALYQKDIRQLQLAKAAIASGIQLLAERQGITVDAIQKVWLAGAFGSFLSPESACRIGLIPPALLGRIEAVGNAAGEGAKAVLLDRSKWAKAQQLARQSDFVELAAMPQFQDTFVDELMFPE